MYTANAGPTGPTRARTLRLALGLVAGLAAGCAGRQPLPRQPRQAVTVLNAGTTTDICRVRVRHAGAATWSNLTTIDPIAPGRSRTMRVPHGRLRFRFEACERSWVLDSPTVDVSFTRVVFMLCDGQCDTSRAPAGAVVVRHNARQNDWGVTEPVYVPTGRRRWRFSL